MIFMKLFLRVFYVFPIIQNRILFSSYNGKQFSCNPRYVYEYLLNKYKNDFQYIWVVGAANKMVNKPRNAVFVRKLSFRYFFYYLTAKIVFSNFGKSFSLPFRNNQFFVETWHAGGAYKKLNKTKLKEHWLENASKEVNLVISSSKTFSTIMARFLHVPVDKFLECGMPRNDLFYNTNTHVSIKVKKYYGINPDLKIALYAPTFREKYEKGSLGKADIRLLNISGCLDALSKRFKSAFIFVSRMHLSISHSSFDDMNSCINATDYPDMQELLCATDVLITDYSSSIWDFSLTGKPCFLYAPDLAQYDRERGFYTPIESWPAILAQSNEELVQNILSFDEESFAERIKKHHEDLGICETGHASQIIGDKIYDICFGNGSKQ